MTVQWVLIASFLYLQLGITVILSLPFISPKIWKRLLCFKIWSLVERKVNMYFSVFLAVLVLFFLDSIREMRKYSDVHSPDNAADLQIHVRLFRSQRNFYIVGFSIFLCFVIRRLLKLIITEADLKLLNEAAMIRAQENTQMVEKLQKECEASFSSSKEVTNCLQIEKLECKEKILAIKNNEHNTLKEQRDDLLVRIKEIADECEVLRRKIEMETK